jgi:heptosyltransferase-3
MESLLDRLPSGSRIAVIRLRSLGDCVLTTPALALLKAYRPDLKITVVAEPRFAAVFEDNPGLDEISPGAVPADLALNLHGGTRSMVLTLASRAKLRAGFAHHRYSFIYSTRIPRAQEILGVDRSVHTAEHLASAMFWIGVPQAPIPRAQLAASRPPDYPPYAVIHPFASSLEKTWPAERFTRAAQYLAQSCGIHAVFLAGPDDDPEPFSQFRVWRNAPLAEVKSLCSGAQLFLGNDSGPAHVAAAFGVPSIVLFGASDPVTWAPWRTESQVLTSREGIGGISPEDVITAIETLKVRA